MTDSIQKEIKEALEKVSPSPWSWRRKKREKNEEDGFYLGDLNHWFDDRNGLTVLDVHNNKHGMPEISAWNERDARLIANAPTWLLHQQELIEQLQQQIGEGANLVLEGMVLIEVLEKKLEHQAEENKRLREALEWYADHRNHPPFWVHDGGEKARQALSQLGEQKS
jgi:hypothetical protein